MFVEIVDEHDPGDATRSHRDVIAIMKVANGTYGASRRWSPFGAGNRRKKARPGLRFASTAGLPDRE